MVHEGLLTIDDLTFEFGGITQTRDAWLTDQTAVAVGTSGLGVGNLVEHLLLFSKFRNMLLSSIAYL